MCIPLSLDEFHNTRLRLRLRFEKSSDRMSDEIPQTSHPPVSDFLALLNRKSLSHHLLDYTKKKRASQSPIFHYFLFFYSTLFL
jgi:hypothetical protein